MMIGNEAIVRGCLECGVSFISQYPGTPTSDIGETFQSLLESDPELKRWLVHHWSINEAVCISEAVGAAWTGVRALAPMKHVGVNVASDALSVIALNGPNPGALVLVVGSDPGSLGSHQEQNERFYGWMFHLPIIEPQTPQECKDWIKIAFELSEKMDIPIYFRTSTRSAHSRGIVEVGELKYGKAKGMFTRNVEKLCSLPPYAINNHIRLYERIEKIRSIIPDLGLNKIFEGTGKGSFSDVGIITSGMPFGYTVEALHQLGCDEVAILKLGMIYPLNEKEILSFIQDKKKIIVIEELEPYLETTISEILFKNKKMDVTLHGKDYFPGYGEYSTGLVAQCLAKCLGKTPNPAMIKAIEYNKTYIGLVPKRFPTFCAGCPERATLYAIRKATAGLKNTVVAGDIGCYVMSFFPPNLCTDFIICMSGGLSAAIGLSEKTDQNILAFIGDSTFLHSGMQPLAEAVNYNSNITLIIFLNSWTAMTGHQPVLGITEEHKISIEQICKAMGVQNLWVVDSYQPHELIKTLEKAGQIKGLKVLIVKRECALQANRYRQSEIKKAFKNGEIVQETVYQIYGCQSCYECVRDLCCPAIRKTEEEGRPHMKIDEDRCVRCGVCFQICPNGAIMRTIVNPLEKEVPFRDL